MDILTATANEQIQEIETGIEEGIYEAADNIQKLADLREAVNYCTPVIELNPLQKKVAEIVAAIPGEVTKYGYYSTSSCDTNSYGWDKLKHTALLYLQNNPPAGYTVSRTVKHDVTDWMIVEK